MNPQLRIRYVAELVRELEYLTGSRFEMFGYEIIQRKVPATWTHRGTTITGAPVGHVVDSVAEGGRLVAQYSTDEHYFIGGMSKIENDINHALNKHPNAQGLWLLSNREASPTATTSVQNLTGKYRPKCSRIEVLDARGIAEYVVENLASEQLVRAILGYLPFLTRMRDELALSHSVPEYAAYVPRPEDEQRVEALLRQQRFVLVSGLSGTGKSALCSAITRRLGTTEFELPVWVDATGIRKFEDLLSIDVLRHGEQLNLLGLLKLRGCLLVLDNLMVRLDAQRLINACGPASAILATSQMSAPDGYSLSRVNPSTARHILEAGCRTGCPSSTFDAIQKVIDGHPLMLGIMNGLVRGANEDWSIVDQLSGSVTRLEDDQYRRVCDRILAQHGDTLRRELEFVAWCESPRIDVLLFDRLCGAAGRLALERRNFLAGSSPETVHIHDLVFESIHEMVTCSAQHEGEFTSRLAALLQSEMGGNDLRIQRITKLHGPLIGRILRTRRDASLRYAYAIARDQSTDPALFGDVVADARAIEQEEVGPDIEIAVRAIIEVIEASYPITRRAKGTSAAQQEIAARAEAYDRLLLLPAMPQRLKADLQHHRAKALLWAGRDADAETAFRALIAADGIQVAARVQLARILAKRHEGMSALLEIQAILDTARSSPERVSPQIILAAFELLRDKSLEKYILEVVELYKAELLDALRQTIASGSDQPFRVVATLGKGLWYEHEELFLEIFDALPDRWAAPTLDEEWFSWAQAQKFAAKGLSGAAPDRSSRLLAQARAAYESMRHHGDFHLVQYAEALILSGSTSEALDVLERVEPNARNVFWHHRRAQALYAARAVTAARISIEEALGCTFDSKYRPMLLHLRWRIRHEMGDTAAITDLRAAINESAVGRFRRQLEEELRRNESQAP